MPTNIAIDNELIKKAMEATNFRTKRAVVEAGLRLLIEVQAQSDIRRLRGKVQWQGDLDAMRRDRPGRG